MRKLKYLLPVIALGLIIAAVGTTSVQADKTEDTTIADRVYIGEVAVGGMTEQEALTAVKDYVKDLADDVITLKAGDYTVQTTVAGLGMTWDEAEERVTEAVMLGKTGNLIDRYKVKKDLENADMVLPLVLTADEAKTNQFIQDNKEALNNEAVDYGLSLTDGVFTVTGGTAGVVLVEDQCVEAVNTFLATGWVDTPVIELPCQTSEPKGSPEELAKVQDKLGTFSTDYSSSEWGRKQNVKNAAGFINGTVVYPGEEFSVYDTISPITKGNGYELAGAYENGQTIDSYGGGVCQVSTTLYNAAIRAELEIIERYPHSMTVSYVDPSADAAIAGTYKNLRFKNTTDAPIYIASSANGSTLTFSIYGEETRPANRTVSFVSQTTSSKDPGVKFVETSAPVGSVVKKQSAHVGKTSKLWKVVKVDGVEQSREVFNTSNYMASPAIYEVGTASAVPEATAAVKAAIASNDLATVKAAAAQWKNATVAPTTPTTPTTPTDPNAGATTPTTPTTPPADTNAGTPTDPATTTP